jgi:glycosyltransferase involved in cell wall biosynthesis
MTKSFLDARPGLAIISNCVTPYRIHLHKILAEGIPELKLHTLVTHGDADFKWSVRFPESINVVHFGHEGESPLEGSFRAPIREWRKGGRLINYLHENEVRAVILNGYRYISYLRVIQHCHRSGLPLLHRNDSNIRSERRLSPLRARLKQWSYAWFLKRVRGVMPMGALGEEFFKKYGADPGRFYRLPYTPDYDAFAVCDPDQLQRFRELYGLRRERRYLLFSGRLAQVKRVDLLIDAFAKIAAERPQWDLLVAGAGPLEVALRQRVPQVVQSRIIWTGFLEQEQLNLAYHSADVLVLPSDHEPWAVVVQEAMSAGLAVVASDVVGAAHELVADGAGGRVFPAGNVEALRQALVEVTDEQQIDQFKKTSPLVLKAWRKRVDPVAEVRRALGDLGVLNS